LLDEPASGLDPRARIEMRELLKELHRMGKTILISSHILLELADLCTTVGVIEKGQLLFHGPMQDIIDRARTGSVLRVVVADKVQDAASLIAQIPGVLDAKADGPSIRVTLDDQHSDPSPIARRLVESGYALRCMEEEKVNLETAFMRLTKGLVQ